MEFNYSKNKASTSLKVENTQKVISKKNGNFPSRTA